MHFTDKFPKTDKTKLARNIQKKKQDAKKSEKWSMPFAISLMLFAGIICGVYGSNNTSNFLEGQIVRQLPVTLSPAPGSYTLESADNGLEVGMFTNFGGDIWYTTDNSSPLRGNWINYENQNLRHYDGIPVIITKNTTINVVAISPITMQITGVQRMTYNISRKAAPQALKSPAQPAVPYVAPFVKAIDAPKAAAPTSGIARSVKYGLR